MKVERIIPVKVSSQDAVIYALRAAKKYRPDAEAVEAKYIGGGSFGRAVEVRFADGDEKIFKFLCAGGMLEKEVSDLRLLKENCTVKMPSVIFASEKCGGIPVDFYCMEKIEGRPAFYDRKLFFGGKKKRAEFAGEVIEGLSSLHFRTSPKFGDTLHPVFTSWRECYGEFAEAVLKEAEKLYAEGELGKKIISAMRAAWALYDDIFATEPEQAVLIHGDLNVMNIMVDSAHRVSGFIDPLNSMYADREYDLFQFRNLTGKRFRLAETYFGIHGASPRSEDKLAFYGLWNEVFCFVRSGVLIPLIMNPLVKNMERRIKLL